MREALMQEGANISDNLRKFGKLNMMIDQEVNPMIQVRLAKEALTTAYNIMCTMHGQIQTLQEHSQS